MIKYQRLPLAFIMALPALIKMETLESIRQQALDALQKFYNLTWIIMAQRRASGFVDDQSRFFKSGMNEWSPLVQKTSPENDLIVNGSWGGGRRVPGELRALKASWLKWWAGDIQMKEDDLFHLEIFVRIKDVLNQMVYDATREAGHMTYEALDFNSQPVIDVKPYDDENIPLEG